MMMMMMMMIIIIIIIILKGLVHARARARAHTHTHTHTHTPEQLTDTAIRLPEEQIKVCWNLNYNTMGSENCDDYVKTALILSNSIFTPS
jgi:uncharacterized membrane protein YcgQ (UPF0703/DUF1980 family)